MEEEIIGATEILNGLKYHAENFLEYEKNLDISNPFLHKGSHKLIKKMNHEAIAYFNRMGQFYYFSKSKKVGQIISDFENHIPNINKFIIFRMKQSAHRATDAPRGEDPNKMKQLDNLFTFQSMFLNGKLWYQVMLDKADLKTGKLSVNFIMSENHPEIVSEIERFIAKISK